MTLFDVWLPEKHLGLGSPLLAFQAIRNSDIRHMHVNSSNPATRALINSIQKV